MIKALCWVCLVAALAACKPTSDGPSDQNAVADTNDGTSAAMDMSAATAAIVGQM